MKTNLLPPALLFLALTALAPAPAFAQADFGPGLVLDELLAVRDAAESAPNGDASQNAFACHACRSIDGTQGVVPSPIRVGGKVGTQAGIDYAPNDDRTDTLGGRHRGRRNASDEGT
jgi:hypothetical protein